MDEFSGYSDYAGDFDDADYESGPMDDDTRDELDEQTYQAQMGYFRETLGLDDLDTAQDLLGSEMVSKIRDTDESAPEMSPELEEAYRTILEDTDGEDYSKLKDMDEDAKRDLIDDALGDVLRSRNSEAMENGTLDSERLAEATGLSEDFANSIANPSDNADASIDDELPEDQNRWTEEDQKNWDDLGEDVEAMEQQRWDDLVSDLDAEDWLKKYVEESEARKAEESAERARERARHLKKTITVYNTDALEHYKQVYRDDPNAKVILGGPEPRLSDY